MHLRFGDFTWGYIGITYDSMVGYVLTHIIVALTIVLAIIGLIAIIMFIAAKIQSRKHKDETPGEYWRRTGRLKEEPAGKSKEK